ncbi:MAG: TolC family protein [Pseudomonadota bacterium]
MNACASRGAILAAAAALVLAGCQTVPEPLTVAELDAKADDRFERSVSVEQEAIDGPVDLYEAMARAIKYNLDHQVELKEEALRFEEFELSEYEMLPDLVASARYTGRSNDPGSSSQSLTTGLTSLEASRSSERNVLEADLTLSWDILDFGLSYVRSKQEADEVLIALEQRRSAINRVIEDVRTAYWRAVSAERLLGRLTDLQSRVSFALEQSEKLAARRVTQPLSALTYQRELLTIHRSVQELRRDLAVAKNQLAALMNVPQGTDYDLVIPARSALAAPIVNQPPAELAKLAFRNRAELREITYRERINEREYDVALLEALPSIRGFLGVNASTNDFLFNQNWVGWGATASWNLINVFRYPQREETIEAGAALLDTRALALTRAIATQVYVSSAQVAARSEELTTASKLAGVNAEIARQVNARVRAGAEGSREAIREELNAILADLRHDIAFADLQNSFANLYASIGLDAYAPGLTGDETVDVMSEALRNLWSDRGDTSARIVDLGASSGS